MTADMRGCCELDDDDDVDDDNDHHGEDVMQGYDV